MNILFIGGAGFIGSNLINEFLLDKNYNIYVYEPQSSNINRLDNITHDINIIRGILADIDLLKSVLIDNEIDIVVHLVSTLIPGSSYEDYKKEFGNIIFPSVQLMSICSEKKILYVFFSSGGTIYGNNSNNKFKETDEQAPISYYGLSKQILENSILFEHRYENLRYLILRPSNPFGKGQVLNGHQGFIAVSIGKILSNEPIEIWGDGKNVRDYIYVKDLADSFYKLIKNNITNEIINIGSGYGYSITDIIDKLKRIVGEPFKVKYLSSRNVDVNSMILDITKLKSYIEVKHTNLEDGIKFFYNYAKTIVNK